MVENLQKKSGALTLERLWKKWWWFSRVRLIFLASLYSLSSSNLTQTSLLISAQTRCVSNKCS